MLFHCAFAGKKKATKKGTKIRERKSGVKRKDVSLGKVVVQKLPATAPVSAVDDDEEEKDNVGNGPCSRMFAVAHTLLASLMYVEPDPAAEMESDAANTSAKLKNPNQRHKQEWRDLRKQLDSLKTQR
jgi:hypothetical protein